MKNIDISFITINYNSSKYTIELINSIIEQTKDLLYEIIVVDNASIDDDLEKLKYFLKDKKDVRLIENRINSGFASGNMLGVNQASGKFYFFINNDCILLNNSTKILKDFLEKNQDVALVTGKILDENRSFSSSYKLFPHLLKELFGNSIQRFFSKNKFPSNKIRLDKNSQVEVVSGSSMFFDSQIFKQIGGFDIAFFLYCEEEDICKRVWDYGKKIYFVPEAEIYHKAGGSTNRNFEIEREFYISYYHLLDKHYFITNKIILKLALSIKLFFRVFKRENGKKIFLSFLSGFSKKESLRYKQKIKEQNAL
ncbi:glycosyltransferase family 2 protein [Aliarcobacter cryaerophilus]|uniref:glycosyltransferase family 2 protein n=1 Tax=Aliarcobacter cryaerophilus TaxID=28198 RepID=UPI0021B5DB20|nr:glycosyltransferase family 2 protein [Aliarcobacter cryaerophilus]MCT7531557.1 glycosyltransferase family 2 protein [Aliarcobacter cryaerophilus]